MQMTGGQALVKALEHEGTEVVFVSWPPGIRWCKSPGM